MRRLLLAAVLGLAAFTVTALATSFDVDATTLAAGVGDVTSCADEVGTSWVVGEYDEAAGDWAFDNVLVTAGSACGGLRATVQLTGDDGAPLGSPHTRTLAPDGAARFSHQDLGTSHVGPITGIRILIND